VKVALIDYGAGNLRSAAKALARSGANVGITSDPDSVRTADRIVLPGDGAFPDCRRGLADISGMDAALDEAVRKKGRPFLGICIGMQLLATEGFEHEGAKGLDWIPGKVVRVRPANPALKVPHMGWNTLTASRTHSLLDGIRLGAEGLHAFFLHAFHFMPDDPADILAAAEYGGAVTAMVARDNIAGTQFHPEKSQALGLALIENFLRWKP
jgi:glutamine amidotransferase